MSFVAARHCLSCDEDEIAVRISIEIDLTLEVYDIDHSGFIFLCTLVFLGEVDEFLGVLLVSKTSLRNENLRWTNIEED